VEDGHACACRALGIHSGVDGGSLDSSPLPLTVNFFGLWREEEEEEEEEGLFKADAVNEEDRERDRATQV